ncbi:MAG TPA: DUF4175 domain-containing protein, partial [Polyangiaceae bacterium]|nr:DUF4175 domain-containing protein [Polyangiaceae bacterium]
IHWEAIDDHGVREVALVLRAGEREERRELSRPQGGVAVDRGGIELQAGDAFLDKSYLPVEVTIEALDNDPVTGPKWGRSAPIIVIPPQIGEREALRYAALARGRNAVIDLLAGRIDRGADNLVGYAARESQLQKNVVTQLNTIATESFGGLHLHGRLAALVRGQLELLDKALQQARVAPGQATHDKLVEQTETALLAVDSALGALGVRDSRESALKLSDVALDVAAAIELSREPAERTRATRRFDADLIVLDEGGKNLLRLGELGVDLGEIVENGLRRIRRGWSAGDRHHARLAALDLAARLRTPDPSFRSSGGGQGQGGTEAGGMPQPGEGEASSAASDAAAVEQALEQLRQEHAAEMAAVERALDSALDPQDKSALQEQLREAAKKVREAVANLPQQASDPSSARASAAQGRSQAEAMAGALERGELSEATEHGKRALDSLKEAQERGGKSDAGSERQMGEESGKARGKLEQLMDEAKRALDKTRREASEGARGDLQRSAKRERELAERAREIRQRSSESEAPLPQEMLERLREAAETMERAGRELGGGDGPKGQETQREAQRLLEMSQPESPQNEREREEQGDGRDFARDADVPPEARDESADAFRKRVTEGLGRKAPPHLRDALRRYTEGLLR